MKKIVLIFIILLGSIFINACGDESVFPEITEVPGLSKTFIEGATAPDFKKYVIINDGNGVNVNVTDAMVDTSNVNMLEPGVFSVVYSYTNNSGNTESLSILFTITKDESVNIFPVITETNNLPKEFTQGDTAPDFSKYVTITDALDGNIALSNLTMDTTNVNMSSIGTFTVIYQYTNSAGNKTTYSIVFRIINLVIDFGNCDQNFSPEDTILDLNGQKVILGTWMRNFLDPFWLTAKPTDLNDMKKTCIQRANTEHNASLGWYAYDNALNHHNEIIQQYVSGDFQADFYNINSHYLGRLVESGAIRPVSDFMKYLPDYYHDINKEFGSWKGEIYGIWNERINVNMGIYVNLDLLTEYGLPNPAQLWLDGEWNWQAFSDIASAIKENAPENIEVFGINNYDLGSYLIGSNGGKTIDPNTNTFSLNDPRAVNALSFAQELKEKNYVWTAEDGMDTSVRAKFTSGELAFYFGSDWISGDPGILKPGSAVKFTLGMTPFPYGPDITNIEEEYRVPITVANLWVMRSTADDAEAEKLFQYFTNTFPWGDNTQQDLRYTDTMRDHMDDRISLQAYVSASRYGYFEKTFLYNVVWALPGSQSVGIGNVYGEIINNVGTSVTATIEAALPAIQARIDEQLGKRD